MLARIFSFINLVLMLPPSKSIDDFVEYRFVLSLWLAKLYKLVIDFRFGVKAPTCEN